MKHLLICILFLVLCSCAPPLEEKWFGELVKVNNPEAVDVTRAELIIFLEQDQTDKNEWVFGEYVCVHFATDLHNNAEAYGIRACIVQTEAIEGEVSHCFNAFETTDRGLVFVDCSNQWDYVFQPHHSFSKDFYYYW